MFNFSEAVKASMIASDCETKEEAKLFLEVSSVDKEVLSVDKVIYTFEDDSFICCDGSNIMVRSAMSDKSEFLY